MGVGLLIALITTAVHIAAGLGDLTKRHKTQGEDTRVRLRVAKVGPDLVLIAMSSLFASAKTVPASNEAVQVALATVLIQVLFLLVSVLLCVPEPRSVRRHLAYAASSDILGVLALIISGLVFISLKTGTG